MKVYQAINAVQAELSEIGISKSRKNKQGEGYFFRGIDDVFNTVSPLLAKHKLCILPRVMSRDCVERVSQRGTALFYVTLEVEFDFICAEDGSRHTVTTYGEAMDTGDKATNKAMSAAYKYAAIQAFAIPTEGDNDTENQTHEVSASHAPVQQSSRRAEPSTLPENQKIDFLSSIEASASEEELVSAYTSAYRAAQAKKDQEAIKAFTEAKNTKKQQLGIK